MKYRNLLGLLLVAVLALSSMSFAFAQDATPVPEPTATFVPSTEGTLTVWADAVKLPAFESIAAKFTEKYGIPVRVQVMGFGDIRNNLQLGGPVGQGPDIIVGAHDWIGQLYGNGLIAPLELSAELVNKFDPIAIKAFTYDGKLVGLPYLTEAVAVYYNTDLVSEVPATWAEAIALGEQLVKDGKATNGLAIPKGDPYHHEALLTGFGGYIFGRDADGNYNPDDVGIDSPGAVKAAEELDRLVKSGFFSDAVDYGAAQSLFLSGKLAMWVTGPWELNGLRASDMKDKYAVAPLPTMDGTPRPFVGSQGFMVNAFGKNILLAQSFLTDFVATDEGMQALYDAVPFVPAWKALAASIDDQDLKDFALSVANGDPMPAIPQMASVWTAWGNAITLIYQQKEEPAKAVQDAAAAIRAEIAKSGS